ncbi:GntR family transcriptional regulator [Saccharopolyspora hirsuta]|uniref:GntR family transcriptional regulator n=1 Tax=Saccharopolyspora hirsuta TaxID=1837 RepID=A0A5M7C182_SACHI|nr:GntR family transcriptional regulator [Saccharopolyspora hirsuta]KAA5835190.1 GntR family transcriptional regulator [Saccharopolyspora hirsuta]
MPRRPRDAVVLTDDERTTLTTWTRSRNCPQALVLRARIVLACEQEATNTAVAERLGTSVDTVRTWRSRFAAERLDGLAERPRPGRPPVVTDDTIAQVIVRTLSPPPRGRRWSTRAMAAAVGLSQTKVSRIWRAYRIQASPGRADLPPDAGRSLPLQVRDLVGLHLAPPLRVLAVAADAHAAPLKDRAPTTSTASKRSAEARDLLAVANAFTSIRGDEAADAPVPAASLRDFLERLHRSVPARMAVHLIVGGATPSAHAAIDTWLEGHPRFHRHAVAPTGSWIDDIDALLSRSPLTGDDVLGFATSIDALREDVRRWCSEWAPSAQPFSWIKSRRALWGGDRGDRGVIKDSEQRSDARRAGADEHASPEAAASGPPRIADEVAQLVREALANGQFKPGERVKEAPLAARLGVSRGPVREALRVLAEEGMLELLPNRGAAVPQISATNILDLYAVRAYLGGLLMRRIATLPRSALRPVSTALAEIRVVARHGDHPRIGEADLLFQDAIARSAQLPQAGRTFEHLTMRLRMFNAILHLDWAEAVDLIARENIGLYEAIRDGDADEAARRWRIKVERSVRYMVAQLPQDHFDPELWATIAGKPDPHRSASPAPRAPRNRPS